MLKKSQIIRLLEFIKKSKVLKNFWLKAVLFY